MNSFNHTYRDQVELLAGEYADDLFEFLNGNMEPYILGARAQRHFWLCMLEANHATAKSALVRFGFDGPPHKIVDWVFASPPPLLWPVIRRCMPAANLPKGSYQRIATHLLERPRSGRVWLQSKNMSQKDWAAALALPGPLIETSVLRLMAGSKERACAVRELFHLSVDQGRDPANLRQAICNANDLEGLEAVLTRTVDADQLPVAPVPAVSQILPLRTKKALMQHGHFMRNCAARPFGGFGMRARGDAFYMWLGDPEGPAMVRLTHDVGWRLSEVKLAENARPPDSLYRRIVEAFATVGVKDRPDVTDLLMAL